MTKQQIKDILDRVLSWPQEEQERVVRFVQQIEDKAFDDDLTDEEWKIIDQRVARHELANDEEVKVLFDRYRGARGSVTRAER
ncbi:MAG: hypothetical protein JOY64_24435 [Alphaproteobacteria bacterium]|nr:hypothetical protein [Alphaproteobacteria bacterium]